MRSLENKNYRVAIYCRLSREDGNEESQSISAQKTILTEYCNKQEGWNIVDIYADDGYSGTNFDRPDFVRLLNDIEVGKIDLVITKDLSRLGRNYIQTGYYTEDFFPNNNIRYIALNDGFDTEKEDSNDFVPFKNIINEWYAKDISKKIRFTLENKAKNGVSRKTNHPIFGYDYNECFDRIPDPETAPIVQLIYRKYIELGSTVKVARYLKEQKIKIPSYYNAIKHNFNKKRVLSMSEDDLINWSADSVKQIIEKDAYIGTYRTALTKSMNFKNKKRTKNKDCYVFEDRYEPLIDKPTWDMANKILKRTRSGTIPLDENIFKGLVYCPDCGKLMRYEQIIDRKTYQSHIGRYLCNNKYCNYSNSIRKKFLLEIIRNELLDLKHYILSNENKFIEFLESVNKKGRELKLNNDKELKKLSDRNAEIDVFIEKLFEQNVKGIIPVSTFDMMMGKYNKEKQLLENQIAELRRKEQSNSQNQDDLDGKDYFLKALRDFDENSEITPQMIQRLIKRIDVHVTNIDGNKKNRSFDIEIEYSYCDEIIKGFMTNEK